MSGFTITCNKCGSTNVEIIPYEEKTVIECQETSCEQTQIIIVVDDY